MSAIYGDFVERIDVLRSEVGTGVLEGQILVDQVYARYQDGLGDINDTGHWIGIITPTQMSHGPAGKPGMLFDHPRGGEAGYLSLQLTLEGPKVAAEWASAATEGRSMRKVMIDQSTRIADKVYLDAPLEYWVLRNSASVKVIDDHAPAFDRPSLIPRLDQAELNAIRSAAGGNAQVGGSEPGAGVQHQTSHTSSKFSSAKGRSRHVFGAG